MPLAIMIGPADKHNMLERKCFDCDVMIGTTVVPLPAPLPDAEALLKEMDYFGIEQALIYHYDFGPEARSQQNELTLRSVRRSQRLVPCWVLSTAPRLLNERLEDQIDEMLQAGVKVARILPDEGPSAAPLLLRLYSLERVFERLSLHRVPLLLPAAHLHTLQAAMTYGFDQVDAICRAFPDLPLVLLNPKYNSEAPLIALMRLHKNLNFTNPTFGLFRQLESMVKMFGAERILFGSGMPYVDPSLAIGMINYAALSPREKRLISGGNLRRLLAGVR